MPETAQPQTKINWRTPLVGIIIGVILVGIIGITFWYFTRPKETENSSTKTSKTATSSATKKEKATLQVTQLETTFGVEGERTSEPPKSINVSIPSGYSDKLKAYFAADLVIVAPVNWTGQGLMAANGSKGVDLRPLSSVEKGKITVQIGSPGTGSCLMSAATYFPWIQAHLQELMPGMPVQESSIGIKRTFISNSLIKYTLPNTADGLEVNGVAYSDAQTVEDHFGSFENIEVSLPPSEHNLAMVILDAFIGTRELK